MPSNNSEKDWISVGAGLAMFVFGRIAFTYLSYSKERRMDFFKQKTTWTGFAAILASVGHAIATRDYAAAVPGVIAGVGLLTAADSSRSTTPREVERAIDAKLGEVTGSSPLR